MPNGDGRRRRTTRPSTPGGQVTKDAIRREAITLFRVKGYDASNLRELAAAVGIEAASLYNHFPSKQALLRDILLSVMHDLLTELRAVSEATAGEPAAPRLQALVGTYVRMHEHRADEALITDTELRALSASDRRKLLALRQELSDLFEAVIGQGVADGDFVVDDVGVTNLAVLSVCARVATWYHPDGRLDIHKIAELLSNLALRLVGAPPG